MNVAQRLPVEPAARKAVPIATGCLDYFPDALIEIAKLSRIANEKHNPGEPMHWSRGKSADHPDAMLRHVVERGTMDESWLPEKVRHSTQAAWRALAILQLEIEGEKTIDAEPANDIYAEMAGAIVAQDWPFRVISLSTPFYGYPAGRVETAQQAADRALAEYQAAKNEPVWQRVKPGDRIRIREGAKSWAGVPLPDVVIATRVGRSSEGRVECDTEGWKRTILNDDILEILPPFNGAGPDHAHGFTVGETVNTTGSPLGMQPGVVVGFANDMVRVDFECCANTALWDSKDLRHGR